MIFLVSLLFLVLLAHERDIIWKDELRLWKDAVSKSPNKARVYVNLGAAYYERGLTDLAIPTLQKAVSFDPNDASSYLNLGVALHSKGRYSEAARAYVKALEVVPREEKIPGHVMSVWMVWKIHNNLGNALREMNMVDDAIVQHSLARELNPSSATIYLNLGRDYEKKGDIKRAREEFLKALSRDQNLPEARQALDRLRP